MNTKLYLIFTTQLLVFVAITTGIIPREYSLFLTAGLAFYVALTSIENAVILFTMSVPLFLALPVSESFDNFNAWRILAAVIFLKWIWPQILNLKFKIFYQFSIFEFLKKYQTHTILLLILLFFSALSIVPAEDKITAIKRIIYFTNLSLIGIVIYNMAPNKIFIIHVLKNMAVPVFIVAVVGYIQVISTYFIDIFQFMRIWGEGIQCRQFGNQWCETAVKLGNTWFAYYGEQLSLRVFSLFPDSHSFPQFTLLGTAAVFAVIKKGWLKILSISALFLIVILSGTRGIWAAGTAVSVITLTVILLGGTGLTWLKNIFPSAKKKTFKNIALYLILFLLLFSVAFPIFNSPQFLLNKGGGIFKERIKSIIDFGETSNKQRLEIWDKTIRSIIHKPLMGVGIGNFPIILNQEIKLAKAGSSAHNIYLHIAAETGILALVMFMWFLWILIKKIYLKFIAEKDEFLEKYYGATLLFVPWVLIYSLTDVALFDERAFLFFTITIAIILKREAFGYREEVSKR